jgi:hypothetical protein
MSTRPTGLSVSTTCTRCRSAAHEAQHVLGAAAGQPVDAPDQCNPVVNVRLLAIADRNLADMGGVTARHKAVLTELTEWWEDVSVGGIGSQVVLLAVPPGWGRSSVLDGLDQAAAAADGPVTLTVRIGGAPTAGRAVQAQLLQQALAAPSVAFEGSDDLVEVDGDLPVHHPVRPGRGDDLLGGPPLGVMLRAHDTCRFARAASLSGPSGLIWTG